MKEFLSVLLIMFSFLSQLAYASNSRVYIGQDSKTGKKIEFKVQENKYKSNNVIKQNVEKEVNPSKVQYNPAYSVKDTIKQEAPSAEEGFLMKTGKVIGSIILLPIAIPVTLLLFVLFAPIYFSCPSPNNNQNGETMNDYMPPKLDYNELKPAD